MYTVLFVISTWCLSAVTSEVIEDNIAAEAKLHTFTSPVSVGVPSHFRVNVRRDSPEINDIFDSKEFGFGRSRTRPSRFKPLSNFIRNSPEDFDDHFDTREDFNDHFDTREDITSELDDDQFIFVRNPVPNVRRRRPISRPRAPQLDDNDFVFVRNPVQSSARPISRPRTPQLDVIDVVSSRGPIQSFRRPISTQRTPGSGIPLPASYGSSGDSRARQLSPIIEILRDEREYPSNGVYSFIFETSDGVYREESGAPGPDGSVFQQGSWSYTASDGTPILFEFVADYNGFTVNSDLLPVGPPMPAHALAQIEKAERERAAGIIHDGQYRPEDHVGAEYVPDNFISASPQRRVNAGRNLNLLQSSRPTAVKKPIFASGFLDATDEIISNEIFPDFSDERLLGTNFRSRKPFHKTHDSRNLIQNPPSFKSSFTDSRFHEFDDSLELKRPSSHFRSRGLGFHDDSFELKRPVSNFRNLGSGF